MSAVLPTDTVMIDLPARTGGSKARGWPTGVLVVGRKRPGFDQEWNQTIRRRVAAALRELSIDSIGAEQPVVDDQTLIAAVENIRRAGCDSLVLLQPSLGSGQLAMTLMQHWSGPVVLWATPERPDGEKVSSCSLVAQHLWASLFRQSGHAFEFVYGGPDDARTRESLQQALRVARTPAALGRAKIGLIGSHAPGFVSMHADPFALKQSLGVQLQPMDLGAFINRVKAVDASRVRVDIERVRALKLAMRKDVTTDDLAVNSRYYLTLRDLIEEERLDGVALQCWPELGNQLGHWPYLALTRLTSEGVVTAMEGDVDGAITCLLGKLLDAGEGFITDWLEHDADTIQFWHGGVAPLAMCESADGDAAVAPMLARHFNIEQPMVVDTVMKADMPVTVARVWRCDGRYHVTAFEGRSMKPARRLGGNTAAVKVAFDVPRWFDAALHAGLPHHPVVFVGSHAEQFRRAARVLKLNYFETSGS